MFGRLFKRIVRRGRMALRPMAARVQAPAEWTNDDAEAFRVFLASPAGCKLRDTLWFEAQTRAMALRPVSTHERGVTAGMCETILWIERMGEPQAAPVKDDE